MTAAFEMITSCVYFRTVVWPWFAHGLSQGEPLCILLLLVNLWIFWSRRWVGFGRRPVVVLAVVSILTAHSFDARQAAVGESELSWIARKNETIKEAYICLGGTNAQAARCSLNEANAWDVFDTWSPKGPPRSPDGESSYWKAHEYINNKPVEYYLIPRQWDAEHPQVWSALMLIPGILIALFLQSSSNLVEVIRRTPAGRMIFPYAMRSLGWAILTCVVGVFAVESVQKDVLTQWDVDKGRFCFLLAAAIIYLRSTGEYLGRRYLFYDVFGYPAAPPEPLPPDAHSAAPPHSVPAEYLD